MLIPFLGTIALGRTANDRFEVKFGDGHQVVSAFVFTRLLIIGFVMVRDLV